MKVRYALLLAVPLALAACNDSTAPGSDQLTREEALMIAAAVSGSVETTSENQALAAQDGAAFDPVTFRQELESSHPCPLGGTVTLQWEATLVVDTAENSLALDVEGIHSPDACAYNHQGITITIDGDPQLEFGAHLAVLNNAPNGPYTANIDGAFNWNTSDGRSGHCDVTYMEITDFAAQERTREGSVCGHSVRETLTWN